MELLDEAIQSLTNVRNQVLLIERLNNKVGLSKEDIQVQVDLLSALTKLSLKLLYECKKEVSKK